MRFLGDGQPRKLTDTNNQTIEYIYGANGQKLAKTSTDGTETYYAGGFVYKGSTLDHVMHSEGSYYPANSGQYYYNLKDHLGNVRLVVNSNKVVVDQNDYYPFGLNMTGNHSGAINNLYKYNGKELQTDAIGTGYLDWHDYGFRMYDASLGRWFCKDPLAELMAGVSSYSYAYNSPANFVDMFGLYPRYVGNGGYYDDELDKSITASEFAHWLSFGRYPFQKYNHQDEFWTNSVLSGHLESYDVDYWSGWKKSESWHIEKLVLLEKDYSIKLNSNYRGERIDANGGGKSLIFGYSVDAALALGPLGYTAESGTYFSADGQNYKQFYSHGYASGLEGSVGLNLIAISPFDNFKFDDLKGGGWNVVGNVGPMSFSVLTNTKTGPLGYDDGLWGSYYGFKIGIGIGGGGSVSDTKTHFIRSDIADKINYRMGMHR